MCLACSHCLLLLFFFFILPKVNLWINSDILQCYYMQFPQSVLLHMSFHWVCVIFFLIHSSFGPELDGKTQHSLLCCYKIEYRQLVSWGESFQVGISDLCVEEADPQTWTRTHSHRFGVNAGSGSCFMSSKVVPFSSRCFLYVADGEEAREPGCAAAMHSSAHAAKTVTAAWRNEP